MILFYFFFRHIRSGVNNERLKKRKKNKSWRNNVYGNEVANHSATTIFGAILLLLKSF